jgi:hypothetical protein
MAIVDINEENIKNLLGKIPHGSRPMNLID